MNSKDSIKNLAAAAEGKMQVASSICQSLRFSADGDLGTDLTLEKFDAAIAALTELRNTVENRRSQTRSKVTEVLSTDRGKLLVEARKRMTRLNDRVFDFIPNWIRDHLKKYDVDVIIPTLEQNPENLTTVCVVSVGHLQDWGDDFDFSGGKTTITVTLPENIWAEEGLVINVEGDEIEDKVFLDKLLKEIKQEGKVDGSVQATKNDGQIKNIPQDSSHEVEVDGIKIVLAIHSDSYCLSIPNVDWRKLGERMQINYVGISLRPNQAANLFERAQNLAREGKTAEDIYFTISQLAR